VSPNSAIPVFDARCTVGRHLLLRSGEPHTAADLMAEMDRYGIGEALVLDSLSRENHPDDGNRRIIVTASCSPRLYPAWSALPAAGKDEQAEPELFLQEMRRHGVAALFLFPRQYRFRLCDWCVDAFLEPLAEAKVPIFISHDETGPGGGAGDTTDWDSIVALCRRWPSMPVIVTEFRIRRNQRMLYRALDACPNLHIELSGYWLHRGIEYISANWGAERLLFGSNWPTFGPHMTLATLMTADISEAEKKKIAGENLRRLIAWNVSRPAPSAPDTAGMDEYALFGRTGVRPGNMTFLDCHGHLGGRASHYHLPNCTTEGIARDMDRLGVRKGCVFSFAGIFSDEKFGNDVVADAVRQYPDRFIGFTLLNPHRGREEMLAELKRCAALGMRGVKLIAYYQMCPEDSPLIEAACRWAHDRRQIILNHNWGPPEFLEKMVRSCPNACYIAGHSTAAYAELMKKYPQIYVCSCPLLAPDACEKMVAAIGADRLLFGSDLQDLPIAWGLGPVLFARIPQDQKSMILGGNLDRLLHSYSLKP